MPSLTAKMTADVGNFEKPRDAITGVLTEIRLQIPAFRLQDHLFPMICFVDPHFARLILVLAAVGQRRLAV